MLPTTEATLEVRRHWYHLSNISVMKMFTCPGSTLIFAKSLSKSGDFTLHRKTPNSVINISGGDKMVFSGCSI